MPDLGTFLTFYAAVLAIQLTPGPDMVLVVGRGIGQGRRVAFLSAIGMTLLAGIVQLLMLAFGIASLLAASPLAFEILRWAGAAYLIWLGVRLLMGSTGRGSVTDQPVTVSMSDAAALREGAINNLTNPKALAFLFAFLPQFVDPANDWPVTVQLLLLGAVTKLSNFAILSTVALGAGTFGGWLARRPGLIVWQNRFAGLVMIGLGLRLAISGDARPAR